MIGTHSTPSDLNLIWNDGRADVDGMCTTNGEQLSVYATTDPHEPVVLVRGVIVIGLTRGAAEDTVAAIRDALAVTEATATDPR